MRSSVIHRFFSLLLLVAYTMVIFSEGVFPGLHIISHLPEVFAQHFSFHSHHDGHVHFHHHELLDSLNALVHETEEGSQSTTPNAERKDWVKLHLLSCHKATGKSTIMDYEIRLAGDALPVPPVKQVIVPPPKLLFYLTSLTVNQG